MLVGRAGGSLRVGLIEDAERKQPQHGPRQRNRDAIASALDSAAAQGREDARGAEPANHVVSYRYDHRLLWSRRRSLQRKEARDGRADLIKAGPVRPGALVAVEEDRGV